MVGVRGSIARVQGRLARSARNTSDMVRRSMARHGERGGRCFLRSRRSMVGTGMAARMAWDGTQARPLNARLARWHAVQAGAGTVLAGWHAGRTRRAARGATGLHTPPGVRGGIPFSRQTLTPAPPPLPNDTPHKLSPLGCPALNFIAQKQKGAVPFVSK
jgi:hypothetical protein